MFKITPRFSSYSPGADIVEQMARNMMAFDPFAAVQYGAQLAKEEDEEPNAPIHDTVIWTAKDGFSFDTHDAEPLEVVPDPIEMEGEPIRADPSQVEVEPTAKHAHDKTANPPQDSNGNIVEVLANARMDMAAIELARRVEVGSKEVAYTIADSGRV